MKKHDIVLWLLFIVFVVIRIMFKMEYWIVLTAETVGLAIAVLIKAKMPSKKYIYISIVLAVLSNVAYLGYQQDPWVLLYGLRAGIPTLLCSFAVFSVMKKRSEYALVSKKGQNPILVSILIALAVGAVLSVVNILISGQKVGFDLSFGYLFGDL